MLSCINRQTDRQTDKSDRRTDRHMNAWMDGLWDTLADVVPYDEPTLVMSLSTSRPEVTCHIARV